MAPKKVTTAPDHELAKWKLNSLVLCRYMDGEVYYEAKIINIKRGHNNDFVYRIHYQGWNARHDEDISEAEANLRFKVHTQHDAVAAKEVIKNALQQSKKKSLRKSADDSDRAIYTPSPSNDPYKKVYLTSGGSSQRQLTKRSVDPTSVKQPPHKQRHLGMDGQIISSLGLRFENVVLSEKLGAILKLDHLLVREMYYLPILPSPRTVDEIIDQYKIYLEDKKLTDKTCKGLEEFETTNMNANLEFAMGLRDYFNVFLKSRFLYSFEREQHENYMAEQTMNAEKYVPASAHYGLPHLLRLIVRLPETLESTKIACTPMAIAMVKYRASVFVQFLHFHWTDFFNGQEDYGPASLNYMTNAPVQNNNRATAMEVDISPKKSVIISCDNKENEFSSFASPTPMEC